MRALREALGGIIIAIITTSTVLGGILLTFSEGGGGPASVAATEPPPTQVAALPSASATAAPTFSPTSPHTAAATTPPATPTLAPTSVPTATRPPATTAAPTATPLPTSTPTVCAPPAGWARYVVQRGDTLFRIGLAHGQTVDAMRLANCLASNSIDAGQIIFVPPRAATASPTETAQPTATKTPTPAALVITNVSLDHVVRDVSRPNGAVAFIRVELTGGLRPYTFFDEGIKQPDNPVQALTECGGTLIHTVRVDSADGQSASKSYYFSPIVCP